MFDVLFLTHVSSNMTAEQGFPFLPLPKRTVATMDDGTDGPVGGTGGICKRLERTADDKELWKTAPRLQLLSVKNVTGMPQHSKVIFTGVLSDGINSLEVVLGPKVAERVRAGKIRVYNILRATGLQRCVVLDAGTRFVWLSLV